MSQLSRDIGNHAPGHRLEHDGRLYEFRHLGLAELAEFERENYRLKRERLRREKDDLEEDFGPGAYDLAKQQLRERYERNELTLQGNMGFTGTGEGMALLLRLMVPGASEDEIAALFRTRMVDVMETGKLVITESLGGRDEGEGAGPNGQGGR